MITQHSLAQMYFRTLQVCYDHTIESSSIRFLNYAGSMQPVTYSNNQRQSLSLNCTLSFQWSDEDKDSFVEPITSQFSSLLDSILPG